MGRQHIDTFAWLSALKLFEAPDRPKQGFKASFSLKGYFYIF